MSQHTDAIALLKATDTIMTEVDNAIKNNQFDIALALLKAATNIMKEINASAKD